MEFRVLGSLEVVDHDGPVALGAPKQRALLAVLLLHRGEPVSTDRLIDEIWGEQPPASATKLVQGYVSNLRKLLGDGRLVTQGRGYVLRIEPGQLDVDRFEALAAEGRGALEDGDALTAAAGLRDALLVWRGRALSDFAYEPFAQPEIARLEEARLAALEDRIDADLASGEHTRLVSELEALVREHPLRERLQGQLMLALYRSGRQADALETYRLARERLIDDLGLEPGPELRELQGAILAHDPALDPPGRPAARSSPETAKRKIRGGVLIAAGAAVLLATIVAVAVNLVGSGASTVTVAPNSLAAIDPASNRVVGAVTVGARPGAVAYGAGSLWTANLDDQTISRIDPGSMRVLGAIPAPAGSPTAIAGSADGLWVVQGITNPNATAEGSISVARIDPEFDSFGHSTRIDSVIPEGPGPVAVQGNSVWVAPSNGLLTRLDGATGAITRQLDLNVGPAGIAITPDGAIWLTDTDADEVVRVDPTGLLTPIPVGNWPTAVAAGAGAVWVVDSLDDTVVRIDPNSRSVTDTIPVGDSPAGIAVGDGSVWVANAGDGTVTRIDPANDHIQATIPVGGSPTALTVAVGRVWVAVDAQSIPSSRGGSDGGTLRIVSGSDVTFMDPAVASDPLSWQLLYATCAKLVDYPDRAGLAGSQLIPEVAEALPTRSPDGKTYTFTIRPGFRFSPPNDQPVTAETFKYTIERTLNHRTGSPYDPYFSDIVGANAYMAGKATHISGVIAKGNKLIIRLRAPAGDLDARMSLPVFCAVPTNTPINPDGERTIPSAGPYYVAQYTPNQGALLLRNPNYHGKRPHHFARIELTVGVPAQRAVREIEAGTADYTTLDWWDYDISPGLPALASSLAPRFGPGSAAAAHGRQQYFVTPTLGLDYFILNTHSTLFSDVRVRQAVNYAINRRALAAVGSGGLAVPDTPTDHYLPPAMPGYRAAHAYPLTPDLAKARQLIAAAHAAGRTAVLYTLDFPGASEEAQIVKNDLARIDLRVQIHTFSDGQYWTLLDKPGAPFDLAYNGWNADYPDPGNFLNFLLTGGVYAGPSLRDPVAQRELAAAARLAAPERYLTYGALDLDLARNVAPLAAYGNSLSHDFFSARIGCQTYNGTYGMDLAALCTRASSPRDQKPRAGG